MPYIMQVLCFKFIKILDLNKVKKTKNFIKNQLFEYFDMILINY